MDKLAMELRDVDASERLIVGVVAPYDEITYLSPHPHGERILRGAFKKSIRQRAGKIPLYAAHDHTRKMGRSRSFTDDDSGLVGEFVVNAGDDGDRLLEDVRHGYMDGLSVGFVTLVDGRGEGGVREVREARLEEVSVVAMPAYAGAAVLSVRNAQDLDDLLAPFRNPPVVNLDPVPRLVYRPR